MNKDKKDFQDEAASFVPITVPTNETDAQRSIMELIVLCNTINNSMTELTRRVRNAEDVNTNIATTHNRRFTDHKEKAQNGDKEIKKELNEKISKLDSDLDQARSDISYLRGKVEQVNESINKTFSAFQDVLGKYDTIKTHVNEVDKDSIKTQSTISGKSIAWRNVATTITIIISVLALVAMILSNQMNRGTKRYDDVLKKLEEMQKEDDNKNVKHGIYFPDNL